MIANPLTPTAELDRLTAPTSRCDAGEDTEHWPPQVSSRPGQGRPACFTTEQRLSLG